MKRALVAIGLALAAPAALAHAFLDHAEPRVGSKVDASPARVTLWFTQALEPAFSRVQVLDAKGQEVDRKDGAVDSKDSTMMHASLPPLAPGKYRVQWRVLSADTHVTKGDFSFEVGGGAR
ncbi:MAG TPA: copper resistance CopC family protein [Usitatibacter sp.]|jgi:methionine-rich copper-binding protein CopC|nr:copper resistance CopC family protein [Usitatibacter sp.]